MSATKIRPLPTLEELRGVDKSLQDAFDLLEQIVSGLKDNLDDWTERDREAPNEIDYEYLGRVRECLGDLRVQLDQLGREADDFEPQADRLALAVRYKPEREEWSLHAR